MVRWYLVHTKPAGETLAEENLQRQGYEVYLPRLACRVRKQGRWRERIVALFPRYLFLRLAEGLQSLAPVCSSIGVASVVRFGSRYAHVPDGVVGTLRGRADPATGFHYLTEEPLPERGAAVRVGSGPFQGLEGIFERAEGSDRVVLLLDVLGRQSAVHIPIDCMLPVQAA